MQGVDWHLSQKNDKGWHVESDKVAFLKHVICGMLRCLDCMHVVWKKCPVTFQGAFTGKEGMPTIVLEAMSDYHLSIWHAASGFLVHALNDLNIWENSLQLQAMLDGTMANTQF